MALLCISCGELREDPIKQICSKCKGKNRSDYERIKDYLKKHPLSNAMQIANETGISITTITNFIKSGAISTR